MPDKNENQENREEPFTSEEAQNHQTSDVTFPLHHVQALSIEIASRLPNAFIVVGNQAFNPEGS